MKKKINKAMRMKLHACFAESDMASLDDFAIEMGITFDEAKDIFYGYQGSENNSYVPDAHYKLAVEWLGENYVE